MKRAVADAADGEDVFFEFSGFEEDGFFLRRETHVLDSLDFSILTQEELNQIAFWAGYEVDAYQTQISANDAALTCLSAEELDIFIDFLRLYQAIEGKVIE